MMQLVHLFMDEITMDPLHAVYLTVGLFVITFFNPGANLFVVVQTSLASGRRAGVLTGLGVALGDAFYSGLGLFGLATLITQCEEIFFAYQNRRRRLSLMVCVVQHAPPVNTANEHTTTTD
ncbi:LysE family translocator [Escherichia coli]|uniref:LysE family translocator n=1 Tax=Escherichia coli TaxID=562 RepID=A0A2X1Q1J6_ECOLX|nr:LysE family translocator [Escherichia coli]VFT70838.1 LysE family translocator [Escherichia coli]